MQKQPVCAILTQLLNVLLNGVINIPKNVLKVLKSASSMLVLVDMTKIRRSARSTLQMALPSQFAVCCNHLLETLNEGWRCQVKAFAEHNEHMLEELQGQALWTCQYLHDSHCMAQAVVLTLECFLA